MCVPPNGLYVKDGYDFMFQEHTYFWDTVLCTYRLLSSMTDAEYDAFHSDPKYSTLFLDGGAGSGTDYNIGINNGTSGTTANTQSGALDNMQSLLTPSQPQSKSKNSLIIILIVAAIGVTAFFLYKKLKK